MVELRFKRSKKKGKIHSIIATSVRTDKSIKTHSESIYSINDFSNLTMITFKDPRNIFLI